MKKSNKVRQALLQRKRTKRNASRKGVRYNPNKLVERAQAATTGSTSMDIRDDAVISL